MGRFARGAGRCALAIVPERKMLSLPTKSFRVKAVVAVVTTYAFCILLPAIAFALADGRMAPPCLMDDLAALSMHDHSAMSVDAAAAHHHHGAPAADAGGMTHHHAMLVMGRALTGSQAPTLQSIPAPERAAPGNAADCFRWWRSPANFSLPSRRRG